MAKRPASATAKFATGKVRKAQDKLPTTGQRSPTVAYARRIPGAKKP